MTLSIASKPADLLFMLNQRLRAAHGPLRDVAPGFEIVDANLDPDKTDDSSLRAGYQVRLGSGLGGFGAPALLVSPSSPDAAALTDWSSPAAIDSAEAAAKRCLLAFMRGLAAMGSAGAAEASLREAALLSAIEGLMRPARLAMEPSQSVPAPEERERFEALCSATEIHPGLASKSALRASLEHLPREEAKALLEASRIEFSAKDYLRDELAKESEAAESARADATPPNPMSRMRAKLSSRRKAQSYSLHKNSSFHSVEFRSFDSAREMADFIRAPGFDLGMEHMVHRHHLVVPDGEIHGAIHIERWADEFLAKREALQIALAAKSVPSAPKPGL